jgi:EAL domain-containing protein (putative c-di-GMP-specific phosphodiesterase class I)
VATALLDPRATLRAAPVSRWGSFAVRRHPREADRLTSVRSYQVMDAPPVPALDAVTRLAARLLGTPVALVSIVGEDRHWLLSRYGLDSAESPPSQSICSDVVAAAAPVIVPDLTRVDRYANLPWVLGPGGARTYAGVPIIGRDGLPLGALCVLDVVPRYFDDGQLDALDDLAEQVVSVLELRRCDAVNELDSPALVPEARESRRLLRALDDQEIVPHFQPLVDMRDGRVIGLEALMRWEHPTRGLLAPDAFLAGLQTGSLGGWAARSVIRRSCELLVDLARRQLRLPDGIAVNLSGDRLSRPGLARSVLDILERSGAPSGSLTLEITETAAIRDPALAHAELSALRAAGVRVVADDFGVGWSNLTRLLQLPLTGFKIDRELVTGMVGDPVRDHMVASAIALGAKMGLDVIAEGVETEAVRDRLLELGCYRGQGWLFSRALPAAAVPDLLTAPRSSPIALRRTG